MHDLLMVVLAIVIFFMQKKLPDTVSTIEVIQ